jgi:hypothetical protein
VTAVMTLVPMNAELFYRRRATPECVPVSNTAIRY